MFVTPLIVIKLPDIAWERYANQKGMLSNRNINIIDCSGLLYHDSILELFGSSISASNKS